MGFTVVINLGSGAYNLFSGWQDDRFLNKYAGMQVLRHIDAGEATHLPYRYVIEKCLSGQVNHIVKSRLAGCLGNVRVLAGNDQMLGRGSLTFASFSDDTESQVRFEFGSTADLFDASELKNVDR